MRISDWSSDVCSSDLFTQRAGARHVHAMVIARRQVDGGEVAAHERFGAGRVAAEQAGQAVRMALGLEDAAVQIGRASCRDRVCPYVSVSVVAVPFKKKKNST